MKTKKINAGYGWRPDKPDMRDHPFKMGVDQPAVLQDKVDLRAGFPEPYDQGQLGSCTANAIAGVLEFDMSKQLEKRTATPSRLFIYYNERAMEGTTGEDAGAEIRDGIKSVKDLGAPAEKLWPYVISKFAKKPTATSYKRAMARQSLTYERIDNTRIDDMRMCLLQGFPFVFGFTVYDNFESPDFEDNKWVLERPTPDQQVLGGHAVVAAGYDHTRRLLLVRNSWGPGWGDGGYFWMSYDYIMDTNLADDFWAITKVE